MQKALFWMLTFAFATIVLTSSAKRDHANTQSSEKEILARRVNSMESLHVDTVGTFESAVSSAGVPGGVAILGGCEVPSQNALQIKNGNLREVLERLVKADPHFHWLLDDGVVNLIPAGGIPPFLQVRIRTFEAKDPSNMWLTADALLKLPEVQRAQSRLGLMQSFAGSILGSAGGKIAAPSQPISVPPIHLQDVTIFEALNAIVRANGEGVWIFNESYCRGKGAFNVSFSQ
ncbi:MAG TPA: hypothetical protein VFZ27_02255 [Terriglobia bacterium]|nr:hypothetical protein [Terriglobia bacterium]